MDGRNGMFTHAFSESSSKLHGKNGLARRDTNIEAARKCYLAAGLDEMWRMTTAEIHRDHYRKYGFMPGFEAIVAGKRALPQPSFLDLARAQWASKGR